MKVTLDGTGRIVNISKQIPEADAAGCSIDVYKFSRAGAAAFRRACESYIDAGNLGMWSEVALANALTEVEFRVCPLDGRWFEIDNHDDLAAAERLFS